MSLLKLPLAQFKSFSLSNPFLHGSSPATVKLSKPSTSSSHHRHHSRLQPIQAMKSLEGRVVRSTNDKTVSVKVIRLALHPKYKKRVRKVKKYQAHDPENQFRVGDIVQLQKCRPISKNKSFIAIPAPNRNEPKKPKEEASQDLGLTMESDSSLQAEE